MKRFVEYTKKTPDQLVEEFTQKTAKHLLLTFQAALLKTTKQNSVRAYVSCVKAFYRSQAEPVYDLKSLPSQMAVMEHVFSTSDLQKMWHIADCRNKALLSVGASLGWDVNLVLGMTALGSPEYTETEILQDIIKRYKQIH